MISTSRISELLRNGEGLGIEFKRCSGAIEHDVFETICSFLNRFGGDILLGVENLYKYAKAYGGADPVFQDGDRFTITIALEKINELMSGVSPESEVALPPHAVEDVASIPAQVAPNDSEPAPISAQVAQRLQGKGRSDAIANAISVFVVIVQNKDCSIDIIAQRTHLAKRSVKNAIRLLRLNGLLKRDGGSHGGKWIVLV